MADLIEGNAVEFLPDEGRDSINAFLRACTPVASVSEQKAADSSTVEAASETHVGKEDGFWPNWDRLFEKETTCQSDRFNFAVTLKGLGCTSEILVAGESHTFRLDSSYASGKMFGSNPTFLSGNEQKFTSDFSEIRDYVIELSGSEKGILFGDVSFEQRKDGVWAKKSVDALELAALDKADWLRADIFERDAKFAKKIVDFFKENIEIKSASELPTENLICKARDGCGMRLLRLRHCYPPSHDIDAISSHLGALESK